MAFRVEISPQAFNDLDETARYIQEQSSFERAKEWFNGIIAAIRTLEVMPRRGQSVGETASGTCERIEFGPL
jgi:plasmid stabilization system protein ParE